VRVKARWCLPKMVSASAFTVSVLPTPGLGNSKALWDRRSGLVDACEHFESCRGDGVNCGDLSNHPFTQHRLET
jgi:hypothetical protein